MARPAAKARVREARNAMYREILLDAAERVFAEHGYDATKMQWIAEEAGVSLATLYGIFPGKSELFRAIHNLRGRQLMAASLGAINPPTGDSVDLLLAGTGASARFHMSHPQYLRMHLRQGHAWAVGTGLQIDEQVTLWREGVKLVAAALERGQNEGVFVADDSPELMARTLMAIHQVRLADWADRGMSEDPDVMVRAMERHLVRVFCTPEVAAAKLQELSET